MCRFHRVLCLFALIVLVPAVLRSAAARAQDVRRPKKLIATGWDKPDTGRLLENLDAMEKRPFDGLFLELNGTDDEGENVALRWAFQSGSWKRAWFQPGIDELKACRVRRLTDNFIQLNANPGNVDWFDDAGWQAIVEHWRTAAWAAKESGAKGILFDPEPYTPPYAQFRYQAQPQRDRHTFDEYYAKARQRGREVMEAVAGEYPDLTLFCYFMNSVTATATGHRDPGPALASLGYGLYPAFIDGWLDVVPPTITMVDGCESAYRYNAQQQYLEAAVRIKGACQELVSPENRAKYRAQVQVSFGIYLDAYWNPKDSEWGRWYVDGLGGPRIDRLRANVQTALRVADEYVWIYGEKFRWWPTPNGRVRQQTWPEALPGCEQILGYARDPLGYARTQLAELESSGELVNLARNGDFGSETAVDTEGREVHWREGGTPAGWGAWQEGTSNGSFTWDRQAGSGGSGAVRMAGVAGGCLIQATPVEPGQRYAVRAACKLEGRGVASIRVRWQTPEGKWTLESQDKLIFCQRPAEGWGPMFGVVEVPEGVGRLVLLLGIRGQESPDDVARYDDVGLYRLP